MRTIRFFIAWLFAIVLFSVAVLALSLLSLEAKVSYVKYQSIQGIKHHFGPKGRHRRTAIVAH